MHVYLATMSTTFPIFYHMNGNDDLIANGRRLCVFIFSQGPREVNFRRFVHSAKKRNVELIYFSVESITPIHLIYCVFVHE